MTLTARAVEAAKPREKPYKLADGEGLYLYVAPAGTKSWRCNYTVAGKQKTRTYGRWPDVSLAKARELHRAARSEGGQGTDKGPAEPTFEEVARQWMRKHLPGLSNAKHQVQVVNTLEQYVFPHIGARAVGELKRRDLVAVLERPELAGKVETAHRVAGRITAAFDYALDAGILESHPAANLSRVLPAKAVQKPMACIPATEEAVGQLLRDIDTYPDPVTRLGLLLAAHTFPRVGELLGFRRDELREDGHIWVVPAERMKLRLPHVIPLSRQTREMVGQLCEMSGSDLVLESPARPGRQLSENTLLFALYRLGYRGRMTVHGFRALASTVLNERSGYARDVIERQLAHRETDDVRAAYNRAEYLGLRREMMQWWSDWLDAAREVH